jgi:tRNA(Ile)-lysidine synthase
MDSSISITDLMQDGSCHPALACMCATLVAQDLYADLDGPCLAMVSGGCDSTALIHLLAALADTGILARENIRVLHVEHGLRGQDSQEDAQFVERLAARLGFSCVVISVDVKRAREERGGSLEAVARELRYAAAHEALAAWCDVCGCALSEGRLLTAHTLDDRVETYFMRSIVGTGPGGLASIPYRNGVVLRPLLDCRRPDLEDYVCAQADGTSTDVCWREDATNICTDFLRNYVRHEIVPRALTQNPALHRPLRRTMDLIAAEDALLADQVALLASRAVDYAPAEAGTYALISWEVVCAAPLPLQRRLFHQVLKDLLPPGERIEAAHIERIVSAGGQQGFAIDLPGAVRIRNDYGTLRVYPLAADSAVVPELPTLESLTFEAIEAPSGERPVDYACRHACADRIYVDAAKLLEACGSDLSTLELRFIRPGDVLCPLGMGGHHRKVQDILVDRKLPSYQRNRQTLLLAGGTPVWLVGVMADARFAVGENPQLMCIRSRDTVPAYGRKNHI